MVRLSLTEAVEYTGFKKSYLYKLTHLNAIPFYKPNGGKIFFDKDELDAWLSRGRVAASYELAGEANDILNGVAPVVASSVEA
jgi:excisionase family DNA binding protein